MRPSRCAALIAPLALAWQSAAHIPEMSPDVVDWWGVAARVGALAAAAGVVHRWQLSRLPSMESDARLARHIDQMPEWLQPRPFNASAHEVVFPKAL